VEAGVVEPTESCEAASNATKRFCETWLAGE